MFKRNLSDNNINANFKSTIITTNYEKSLRKAITEVLKPKYLQGCYFHFSKAIWKKCRDYGLTSKKFKKESIIFTFCLKIYPYIHNINRIDYIEKLKDYIKDKDKRFHKFLNYFIRNWSKNKSFNFNRISNGNYERRTNNICESFHRILNKIISHYHPKITFLIDKLKFFACDAYKKYSTALVGALPDSKKET